MKEMPREELIKTGNSTLDKKIERAFVESREKYGIFPWRKRILLKALFKAVIGFRVSVYLNIESQKSRYSKRVNYFYELLEKGGMKEEDIAGLVNDIREKFD
ncbi:MAG: hypothetical protein PHS16_02185 [Candidatus Colwellbacteria bacterium]|nr:hypothetical protein [Candidatus Colwellbacteria bacterium]MDD3752720.1 hypothetical protein [Candidatus Colwellbacteria bacterium]